MAASGAMLATWVHTDLQTAAATLNMSVQRGDRRPSLGSAMRSMRSMRTALAEVQCRDGFRCASLVDKFGRGHIFGGAVSASSGAASAAVASAAASDADADADAPPLYEWNCPYLGQWATNKYTTGKGADACEVRGQDCVCVPESPDMRAAVTGGEEIREGKVLVDSDGSAIVPGDVRQAPKEMRLVSHYTLRQLPESFDVGDPQSNLGKLVALPSSTFREHYSTEAPRLQRILDRLKVDIEAALAQRGSGDLTCGPRTDPANKFTLSEAQLLKSKIRRFEMLASDCATMRDAIGKVAPTLADEEFDGKDAATELQCYRRRGAKRCAQLRCYSGARDVDLLAAVRTLDSTLNACLPEQEATEEHAQPLVAPPLSPTAALSSMSCAAILAAASTPFAGLACRQRASPALLRCGVAPRRPRPLSAFL